VAAEGPDLPDSAWRHLRQDAASLFVVGADMRADGPKKGNTLALTLHEGCFHAVVFPVAGDQWLLGV